MASYRQPRGGRAIFILVFFCCISLIGYALYLQLVKNLLPCPLCVVQRIAYWLVGFTALLAFFIHRVEQVGASTMDCWRSFFLRGRGCIAAGLARALSRGLRMWHQPGGTVFERVTACPVVAKHV